MNTKGNTKVPPDGGWGWMIVLAYALNGISTIPIIQGFGLIFKDTFPSFGFNATDGSIIINTNLAFGMILGLINGPLLRRYGYKKVAIAGSFVYTIGVVLTAFAKNFSLMFFSYGIFASVGVGLTMSAFSLALNSYFTKRRNRATGLALTITGLGSIIMPQVTSLLIAFYGFQGTMLLYGSVTLHSLIGGLLLHPIKWHLKTVQSSSNDTNDESTGKGQNNVNSDEKNINTEDEENPKKLSLDLSLVQRKRKTTISSIDHDIEVGSIYGFDTPLPRQLSETLNAPSWDKNIDTCKVTGSRESSMTNFKNQHPLYYSWWSSAKSVDVVNLGSCMKIFDESPASPKTYYDFDSANGKSQDFPQTLEDHSLLQKNSSEIGANTNAEFNKEHKKKSVVQRALIRVANFYDLSLLRDPIYVNIMLGMSIAIFAEVNFSVLTPFILGDMGLSTKKIATVMSLIASVDLVFRSLAPFLGEWLRQPPRTMYLLSLSLLIVSRTTLILVDGYIPILLVGVGLGAAKGIRSVYMSLVIPSYVPIDRLPYASGIQMVLNGLILLCAGPIIGRIRDYSGSYVPCIILINCVTMFTVTIWLIEMWILRQRKLRKRAEQEDEPLRKS